MTDFYSSSSRLGRKKLKQAYLKIFSAITFSILLVLAVIYLGIPGLVKLSGFLGNFRSSSEPVTTFDTTPPFPPRLESISEATNSAQILIKGLSEPGSTVELFLNGETYKKVLASKDGAFEAKIVLEEGENRILAQATDNANNVSQPSQTLFITYRKSGPKLEVSEPKDNANFKGKDRTINIQGFSDPEATVTINDRYVILNPDGSFSYPYSLSEGENLLKIVAIDLAGNETVVERKVNYSL